MTVRGTVHRTLFWAKDAVKNHGALREAYDDIIDCYTSITPENTSELAQRRQALLDHATSTTKFYARYQGATSIEDFPVITKLDVIDHYDDVLSSDWRGKKLHEMHTSGSTGIPFTIRQDPGKRLRVIAELKAFNEIAQYPSHERMLFVAAYVKRGTYPKRQEFAENIYRISVGVNDPETMDKIVTFIERMRPWAIHISASNLLALVTYLQDKQVPYKRLSSVRSIITGGETVPAKLRSDAEAVFGPQCHVYVHYSNEEMGIFGIDTGQDTPYILNWANYYFEILKMDSNEPAGEGELGRIVITDLFNYAMPLIRYDTGDIGSIVPGGEGKRPVMNRLSGKRRDLLFDTRGYSISGPAVTNLLKHVQNVRMYQVIQKGEKEYVYKVVGIDGNPTPQEAMLGELQALLGQDAHIEFDITDEIPVTNSQKRRYTVNEWRSQ